MSPQEEAQSGIRHAAAIVTGTSESQLQAIPSPRAPEPVPAPTIESRSEGQDGDVTGIFVCLVPQCPYRASTLELLNRHYLEPWDAS
jgi:hypothetical protein